MDFTDKSVDRFSSPFLVVLLQYHFPSNPLSIVDYLWTCHKYCSPAEKKNTHTPIDWSIDRSAVRSMNRSNFIGRSICNIIDGKKGQSCTHLLALCSFSVEADSACWSFDERLNVKRTLWPSIRFALWIITIRNIILRNSKKKATNISSIPPYTYTHSIHLNILPWKRHLNIDITWIDYMIYTFVAGPKRNGWREKNRIHNFILIALTSLCRFDVAECYFSSFCIHFVPNMNAHCAWTRLQQQHVMHSREGQKSDVFMKKKKATKQHQRPTTNDLPKKKPNSNTHKWCNKR